MPAILFMAPAYFGFRRASTGMFPAATLDKK